MSAALEAKLILPQTDSSEGTLLKTLRAAHQKDKKAGFVNRKK